MKIIKEGKIPEEKTSQYGIFYRGKCSNCGCEFEAHEDEFLTKESLEPKLSVNAYDIEATLERVKREFILCPTCSEEVIIN